MLDWFARRMKEAREDEQGFTLIELLVVVIIIGILAAIAIPAFLAQRDRAREATARSDVRNAATAAQSCATQNGGNFSTCNTAAALQPFGFNTSAGVTVNGMNASATGWTTSMQHTDGGSAYTFTTANGRVVEAARGTVAPAAP